MWTALCERPARLTERGCVQQTVPVSAGRQRQQILAVRNHFSPPVQPTCRQRKESLAHMSADTYGEILIQTCRCAAHTDKLESTQHLHVGKSQKVFILQSEYFSYSGIKDFKTQTVIMSQSLMYKCLNQGHCWGEGPQGQRRYPNDQLTPQHHPPLKEQPLVRVGRKNLLLTGRNFQQVDQPSLMGLIPGQHEWGGQSNNNITVTGTTTQSLHNVL